MENFKQLKLLKARFFGEKISDTFTFVRINLGVLIRAHFMVSLPIIIVTAGLFILLFRDYFSLLQTIESGPFADSVVLRDNFARFCVHTFFAYLAIIPVQIVSMATIDAYTRGNGEAADFKVVLQNLKQKFLRLFLIRLLVSPLVIMVAFLIFMPMGPELTLLNVSLAVVLFIPGIIFYNLFICADLLVLQHNYPLLRAINRSSSIISRNFWSSMGSSIGMLLLYFVFCLLLIIPLELLGLIKDMTSGYVDPGSLWGIFLVTIRAFNTLLGYVLFSIPVITAGIEYFTIRETNSRAGIMERIGRIGLPEEKRDFYVEEEQY